MREKLKILSEILKQKNPAIKDRLERLEFGCFVYADRKGYNERQLYRNIGQDKYILVNYYEFDLISKDEWDIDILGNNPQFSDILEYFGEAYSMDCELIYYKYSTAEKEVKLSPGALSDQTDETLDEIISLCKNVGK